jgi:sugar/nucleoside kinase (ribokinase family)
VTDLLVVGDVNPDLVLSGGDVRPRFGQREAIVESGRLLVGGSASITACGAARLDVQVALCSVVGDDAFGRFMLDALRSRGVDVSGVRVDESLPTGVSVILGRGDDRAILTALGTVGTLAVEDIAVSDARHVHVSSLGLQPRLASDLPALAEKVHAAGATLSVDPNWDPSGRWSLDLTGVDVLFPNEAEALALAGVGDVEVAAAALAARGPLVVVKRGAAGALAHDGARAVSAAAPGVPEVVDSTGAGDSFAAGFLAARLDGAGLEDALRLGCACGAASVTALGGTAAQPTRAEALSLS